MVIFCGDLHHETLHEDYSKSLIFCPNEKITTYRLGLLLFLGELFLLNPQNSTDGSQSLFFHETSMKSDLLHSASAIIPFPARWHQVSPAGLLLILNLFTKPASMRVCPSVGLSVFVCAPAAEPSWHSAETSWQKTERLLLNLHQRCPFIFLLKH